MTGDLRALRSLGELVDREPRGGRALATVRPGQWLVAEVPTNVAAVVDASVVVCLWDVGERLGGAGHVSVASDARRIVLALVGELEGVGCARRRLRAKLFGGADVTPARGDPGARNVAAVEALLASLAIPVVARDTGGVRPRKLAVHTDDFCAWVWRV